MPPPPPRDDPGRLLRRQTERTQAGVRHRVASTSTGLPPGAASTVPALDDLLPALRTLARSAGARVAGADGAGVTVVLGSGPVPAGSDGEAEAVETLQHRIGEGPVPTALRSRTAVRWSAPEPDEARWPWFVERVRVFGVRGAVSVPLVVDDEPVGALTLYHRDPRDLEGVREAELQGAARSTLETLLDVRLRALLLEVVQCLAAAQRERAEVDLAVGLLVDRYGFSQHQALVLIVQLARQDGVGLAAAARALTGRDGSW